MEKVHLNLKKKVDNSYDILIDKGLFGRVAADLKGIANRYVVITDSVVEKLFAGRLLKSMRKAGLKVDILSFKAGEGSKNIAVFNNLIEKVHLLGLDRKSCIVALGGGVAGDMAGFVAACYMRGISYVQIPTTLLAMVDSSIGGKVAVDLSSGKNSCGAFYQPKKVYIDVSLLKGLPKREMLCGLAEIIKHAVMADAKLFSFIEKNISKILEKDEAVLIRLIKRNCEIKARIVEKDEREQNLRKIVNYGHTIGHALETLTGYKKYSHGEAIAIGMAVEARISNKLGLMPKEDVERQSNLLTKVGLKIELPKISIDSIVKELVKDKKAVSGRVQFVLPLKIGKMKTVGGKYGINVSNKVVRFALK